MVHSCEKIIRIFLGCCIDRVVLWLDTNVSEDRAASIFIAEVLSWSFEMLVSNHHTTRWNNPQNHEHYIRRCTHNQTRLLWINSYKNNI